MPSTLSELIFGFKGIKDRGIYFFGEETEYYSYDTLYLIAQKKSSALAEEGVQGQDRVIVDLHSDVESVTFLFALLLLGAIPVSIKPKDHYSDKYSIYVRDVAAGQKAKYVADNVEAVTDMTTLAVGGMNYVNLREYCYPPSSGEVAFIQYSSGSTSSPKAVPLSHRAIIHNLKQITLTDGRVSSCTGLNVLPLCHDMGLIGGLLSNFIHYNTLILCETKKFLRNPLKVLKMAFEHNVIVSAFPNTILGYLSRVLSIKKNLPPIFRSFSTIYVGAEPIRRPTIEKFIDVASRFGVPASSLVFCYGLAEAALIVSAKRFNGFDGSFDSGVFNVDVANTGSLVEGVELDIVHQDKNGVGDIMLRGKSMFSGYEENVEYLTEWFDTGDIGYMKDGDLYISGRRKELIIVGGENYYANDIETYLMELFEFDDCLAIQSDSDFILLYSSKSTNIVEGSEVDLALSRQFGVSPNRIIRVQATDIARTSSGKPIKNLTLKNVA